MTTHPVSPGPPAAAPSSAVLASIAAHIRGHLPRYFPDLAIDPAGAHITLTPLGESSSYPLYAADIRGETAGPHAGIVMKLTPTFGSHSEGKTEYDHLRLMHARLGDSGELRVPRPLDFIENAQALLTERVGGVRFSRVLLRGARWGASVADGRRLHDAAARCGRWLSEYHAATAPADAEPFDAEFVGAVETGLATLAALGLPGRTRSGVMESVRRLHDYGRGRRVRIAVRHGDFGPQNVHVGDDYVCVFDLSHHARAPVYEDVVYFLVTLDTLNPYPREPWFDRARVRAMRRPFLEGYFGPAIARDDETTLLLEGYYLKALIARCLKQRRNTAARGRLAAAVFDRVWIRWRYPHRMDAHAARVTQLLARAPRHAP